MGASNHDRFKRLQPERGEPLGERPTLAAPERFASPNQAAPAGPPAGPPAATPEPPRRRALLEDHGFLESLPQRTRTGLALAVLLGAILFAATHHFSASVGPHGETTSPEERAALLVLLAGVFAYKLWRGRAE